MKKVLFVCVENACRSQMAEAFLNKYAKDARAYSAGSNPAKKIDPTTVEVMREKGFDLTNKETTNLIKFLKEDFDFVVTMGCNEVCPITPKGEKIEWNIEDPRGKSIQKYREIRDIIEAKVRELIKKVES